ncbi:MAG: phosphoribosyltransferase [Cytophagaceae bacterium]|nr:phosphoribosyltransferase [Cytophagaceae bacterium]
MEHLILDKAQTLQKIKRIAIEIYERNLKEKEIVLAGIYDKGYAFAELLQKELNAVSDIQTILVKVSLDKTSPLQSEITLDTDIKLLKKKTIILIDDVLNTGRTLAYSLKPFLNIEIKKLQVAVVVDRQHKSFPISPDYVGYSLSTTLKEHIEVSFEKSRFGVYLH